MILAITGASGFIYGVHALKALLLAGEDVQLIISDNARLVAQAEHKINLIGKNLEECKQIILKNIFGDKASEYSNRVDNLAIDNVAACIASGSYGTKRMLVAPCSMGTLAHINQGTSHNLISRAADVVIKERGNLVLMPRETPLSPIHLRNMLSLSELGVSMVAAMPGFYHHPESLQDQVDFVVGKALDQLQVDHSLFQRWGK